jgi:hypothetical protein
MRLIWRCRFQRISFGLTNNYIENVYEQFFFLQYNGGWSLTEIYNLPVGLREWYVKRLVKQLEEEKEAMENASKNQSGYQTLTKQNQPKR